MPIYEWSDFLRRRVDGTTRGCTRGPRGPKTGLIEVFKYHVFLSDPIICYLTHSHLVYSFLKLYIRVWWENQFIFFDLSNMFSSVKLNFQMGLFSSIFRLLSWQNWTFRLRNVALWKALKAICTLVYFNCQWRISLNSPWSQPVEKEQNFVEG